MELFWVSFGWRDEASPTRALWQAFATSSTLVARDDGSLLRLWLLLRDVAAGAEWNGKDAQLVALQNALLLEIARLGAGESVHVDTPRERDPHRLARLAARYIDDNLSRRLTVDEIAAHVGVSPRHFARLFIEFTGASPLDYLTTARLDRAQHLLKAGELEIKVIAGHVGFSDVQHFTRVFSRRFGVAPAAWRSAEEMSETSKHLANLSNSPARKAR
jgi:AraC family L-rhamnose operon transcriptional activator RhaR